MNVRFVSALFLFAGLLACDGKSPVAPNPQPTPVPPSFVPRVMVTYSSLVDHDLSPYTGDFVTFDVTLANPDGTVRSCRLQNTTVRPFGSDCPEVGSTVDKIAPLTFRAYLYNVWVNRKVGDTKHLISVVEDLVIDPATGRRVFLTAGNNILVDGATDQEVKITGSCGNCVYGQTQGLMFRMGSQ